MNSLKYSNINMAEHRQKNKCIRSFVLWYLRPFDNSVAGTYTVHHVINIDHYPLISKSYPHGFEKGLNGLDGVGWECHLEQEREIVENI